MRAGSWTLRLDRGNIDHGVFDRLPFDLSSQLSILGGLVYDACGGRFGEAQGNVTVQLQLNVLLIALTFIGLGNQFMFECFGNGLDFGAHRPLDGNLVRHVASRHRRQIDIIGIRVSAKCSHVEEILELRDLNLIVVSFSQKSRNQIIDLHLVVGNDLDTFRFVQGRHISIFGKLLQGLNLSGNAARFHLSPLRLRQRFNTFVVQGIRVIVLNLIEGIADIAEPGGIQTFAVPDIDFVRVGNDVPDHIVFDGFVTLYSLRAGHNGVKFVRIHGDGLACGQVQTQLERGLRRDEFLDNGR